MIASGWRITWGQGTEPVRNYVIGLEPVTYDTNFSSISSLSLQLKYIKLL